MAYEQGFNGSQYQKIYVSERYKIHRVRVFCTAIGSSSIHVSVLQ